MTEHRIFTTPVADVYPHYVAKAERKGHTRGEVDLVVRWLTGYDDAGIVAALANRTTFRDFFAAAPAMNPRTAQITGVICGIRVEEIEDPLMQQVRWMDKLVDEMARGKKIVSVLRGDDPADFGAPELSPQPKQPK